MQMDADARAVVAQLVAALAPLNYPVLPAVTPDGGAEAHVRESDIAQPMPAVTVAQARAATAALVAGRAALAATGN